MQPQETTNIAENDTISFDEAVRRALEFCESLPAGFAPYRTQLAELQTRLSGGRLHFAVLGQFNRGKSTFINALLGMKTLPASVLPLTSVPTVIEYGTERSCKIRFTDGKDDLVVKAPAEEIEKTLKKYVAEENNPKNIFGVRDATVTCQSDLLVNGTVLIDTPGFGSTYLHNTQTTLDLLIECDAAIFLLSADPPMTQAEMEFLRGVKERVPKLFFVLNKVDLLTPEGLLEVDRFIKNILHRELGFPSDTTLYQTSGIIGESAKKQDKSDAKWTESGLGAVKKEILDFMVREKYFTLAEALQGKYSEAIAATGALLEKMLAEKLAPLNSMRKNIGAITTAMQPLSLEMETHIKKCAAEKETLDAANCAYSKENLQSYTLSMKKALDVLLGDKYFPAEAANLASTMLPKHSNDLGAKLLSGMLEAANRSIRSVLIHHHAQSLTQMKNMYTELLGENESRIEQEDMATLMSRFEIDVSAYNDIFNNVEWDTPIPQVRDIFRKKAMRFEAIREFYEPLCINSISENISKAEKKAREIIDGIWAEMQEDVCKVYRMILDKMKKVHKEKDGELMKAEGEAKGDIVFLKGKIQELKGLVL